MAKILVTDDTKFMRDMISATLAKLGHESVTVESGEEMLKVYDTVKPDIVFLDIVMPDEEGLSILVKLKETHPNAKVVICSAVSGQPQIVEEAMEKGAVCCIRKPFKKDELEEAINKCIQ